MRRFIIGFYKVGIRCCAIAFTVTFLLYLYQQNWLQAVESLLLWAAMTSMWIEDKGWHRHAR